MKALKDNKGTLTMIILIIIGIFVYKSYSAADPADSVDPSTQNIGSDLVALNASLQSITLSQTVFTTPAFKGLVDYSTPIPMQPVGRTDPFAPL